MSAISGHNLHRADTYADARQRTLQRVLETHGPLTRDRLLELAHAGGWAVEPDAVIRRAEQNGRIRRLTGELFEAAPADGGGRTAS